MLVLATLAALLLASVPAAAVEVDPAAQHLPEPRYGYGMARISGSTYLVGGAFDDSSFSDDILKMTKAGDVEQAGSLDEPLLEPAVAATGSTVYIFGGAVEPTDGTPPTTVDTIRTFDPSTGETETLTAALPEPVSSATAVRIGAYIYILGGLTIEADGDVDWHDTVVRFDPGGPSTETLDATLPTGRAQMASVVSDGTALLFGGMALPTEDEPCPGGRSQCPTDAILRFRPDPANVGGLGEMPERLRWASAAVYQDTAYVFGGCQANCGGHFGSDAIVAVDTSTGSTETLPVTMPSKGGRHSAVAYDDAALVPGGVRANGSATEAHDAIHRIRLGATPPWAPIDLTVAPGARGAVELAWEPPAYDGGADVTGYRVLRSSGAHSPQLVEHVSGTSHTDTSVELGTTYRYHVRAVNPTGVGTASNEVIFTPTATPGAPTVTAVGGDEKIVVQWSPPDETGGSNLTGYRVLAERAGPNASADNCDDASCFHLEPTAGYLEVGNVGGEPVENGDTILVRVRAQNDEGLGPASDVIEATAHPVPDPPTNLRATKELQEGRPVVDLTWKASPSDETTGYQVYRGTSLAEMSPIGTTDVLEFEDDQDVPRGVELLYGVTATSSDAESPLSKTVRLVFPEPPGPVRNLSALQEGNQVVVAWKAPASFGGGVLKGYDVAKTRGAIDPEEANATTIRVDDTAYRDDAPPRGQPATYHVRAVTGGGTGPWEMSQVRVSSTGDASAPTAVLSARPSNLPVGSNVAFDASGSRDDTGIAAYKFDFGDGAETGWQNNPRAAHAYGERGVYTAELVVRDVAGKASTPATATIAVGPPEEDPGDNETPPPDDDGGNLLPVGTWVPVTSVALAALAVEVRRRGSM